MNTLYKEYHKLENDQEIKFSISFNKNTINWATSQPKKIGYQIHALPVKRQVKDGFSIEETGAFTGFCANLLEAKRQSKLRLLEAKEVLISRREKYLDYFRVTTGIMKQEDYKKKYG